MLLPIVFVIVPLRQGPKRSGLLASAFETYIFVVIQHLQTFEAVNVVICFSVFTRHAAAFTAGNVHVLQIFACRKESSHVGSLFPSHVPEVTHTAYTRIVDVAADGSCIRYLTKIECFFPVERFKDNCSPVLFAKLPISLNCSHKKSRVSCV